MGSKVFKSLGSWCRLPRWHSVVAALTLVGVVGSATTSLGSASAGVLPYHVVTFHENASVADSVVASETNNVATALTLFVDLSPSFSNPGSAFRGWNTSAFGNGTSYSDGSAYDFSQGSVDLYAQWSPNSATFYENRSGSDATTFVETSTVAASLTSFSSISPAFTNPGYTFAGWNTSPTGTGTPYANGATFNFVTGSIVLYAQWTAVPSVSVSFVTLAGSGSVPSLSGLSGSTFTLPSGSGFTRSGYIFSSWNTAPDGSGVSYSPGATVTVTTSTTFYAQWTAVPTATITFSGSGANGTVAPIVGEMGGTATVPAGSSLTRPGYTFEGWNTAADGSGTPYAVGATVTLASDVVLYAQWSTNRVTFHENASPTDQLVATQSSSVNTALTSVAALSPTFAKAGFVFLGWNTAPDGSGAPFADGATFPFASGSSNLYAQWGLTVTVTFSANGASGTLAPVTLAAGSALTLPGATALTRAGYVLSGWSTTADGKGTTYPAGSTMSATASVTLFAVWNGHAPAVALGFVGTFAGRAVTLTSAMRTQIDRFAARIKASHYTTVLVYGYAPATGLVSLTRSLSAQRAGAVATYLRARLAARHLSVVVKSAGEGSLPGASPTNYKVEIFAY